MIEFPEYVVKLLKDLEREVAVAHTAFALLRDSRPSLIPRIEAALNAAENSSELQTALHEKHAVVDATLQRLRQQSLGSQDAEKTEKEILEILRDWNPGKWMN